MKIWIIYIFIILIGFIYYLYQNSRISLNNNQTNENIFKQQKEKENNILYPQYSKSQLKNNQRRLIITVGYNYTYQNIDIFFSSLNETNYKGEKLIFIHETVVNETLEYLEKRKVKYIFLIDEWPYFSKKTGDFKISMKTINEYIPKYTVQGYHKFSTVRHFLVLALLMEYKSRYDIILLIDSRDVYFQKNPFTWNIKKGISLFEESRANHIFDQPRNNLWVKNLGYAYEKVKNNYILNGGAIYFTTEDGIKFYNRYRTFFDIVKRKNPVDQPMINIMIYDHYYNGRVNIYPISSTPVRNLALEVMTSNQTSLNLLRDMYSKKNNVIYNEDKSIPVVIHQYDRLRDLSRICKIKYSS